MASTETAISAEALAQRFTEGRDAFRACLQELVTAGFVTIQRQRINGRWVSTSGITSAGFQRLESRLLLQRIVQNSNNTVITDSYKSIRKSTGGAGEEENVGYDFFEKTSSMDMDERLAERSKAQAQKKADYESARTEAKKNNYIDRHRVPQAQWSVTDVAYEFADRIQSYWHIKPWSLVQSRFTMALGTARKQHDTNGAIEVEAMNRFFDSVRINDYDDAEILWKMFIKQLPSMVSQIKNMVDPDAEVSEGAKLRTAKGLSRLDD